MMKDRMMEHCQEMKEHKQKLAEDIRITYGQPALERGRQKEKPQ